MKTVITTGLSPEKKKDVESSFNAAKAFRERLTVILQKKADDSRSNSRKKDYSDASWAYSQADAIGYERALFQVISLLDSGKD